MSGKVVYENSSKVALWVGAGMMIAGGGIVHQWLIIRDIKEQPSLLIDQSMLFGIDVSVIAIFVGVWMVWMGATADTRTHRRNLHDKARSSTAPGFDEQEYTEG